MVYLSLFKSWQQGALTGVLKFTIDISRKQRLNKSSEELKGYNLSKYYEKDYYTKVCGYYIVFTIVSLLE